MRFVKVMEMRPILLLLISVQGLSCTMHDEIDQATRQSSKRDTLSRAINSALLTFNMEKPESFDIMSFAKETNKFDDIIQNIIKESIGGPHKLHKFTSHKNFYIKLKQSAILLFDSRKLYKKFLFDVILDNLTARQFHFLVYYPGARKKHFKNMEWMRILQFQSILIRSSIGFKLISIARYTQPRACKSTRTIPINAFTTSSMNWTTNKFFSEPMKDFKNCSMLFGYAIDRPASYKSRGQNGKVENIGYNVQLIKTIASKLKFKCKFTRPEETSYGQLIVPPSMEMNLVTKVLTPVNIRRTFTTQPYVYETLSLLVPPGAAYSSFEKLFLPFEIEVWIWLAVTLVVAVAIITSVNLSPLAVQEFVFGANVSTPTMNLWVAMSGLGQFILPKRNFARFILMMYILLCLVIRTAYQGKSFEFLQQTMLKKEVQTIQEMIDRNFTLYAADCISRTFSVPEMYPGLSIVYTSDKEGSEISKRIYRNSSFNGAAFVNMFVTKNFTEGTDGHSVKLLKEGMFKVFKGLQIPRNSVLFESFNNIIKRLLEGGILQIWIKQYYEDVKKPEQGPTVLTMEHLSVGFFIWLFFLLLAALGFIIEKISKVLLERICRRINL